MARNPMEALGDLNPHQIHTIGRLLQFLQVDGGAAGAPRSLPYVKGIQCENYAMGSDFDAWVDHFWDNVRVLHEVEADDPRLPSLYLKWISTILELGPTRAVFDSLPAATKAEWDSLHEALSEAFMDESERLEFLTRTEAHQRTPGMSLRVYRDSLVRKMDKYQPQLRQVPSEWERSALQRFREGLNNQALAANLMMNCVGAKATLEHAFQTATNYENTMSQLVGKVTWLQIVSNIDSLVLTLKSAPALGTTSALGTTAVPVPKSTLSIAHNDPWKTMVDAKLKEFDTSIKELKANQEVVQFHIQGLKLEIREGFKELRQDLVLSVDVEPEEATNQAVELGGMAPINFG